MVDSITFAFIHLIIRSFLPASSFYERQTADIKQKCRWRMVDSILLSFIHLFFHFVPPSAGSIKYEKRGKNENKQKTTTWLLNGGCLLPFSHPFSQFFALSANSMKGERRMRKKREDTIEKNTKIDGRMVDTTCFYSFVRSFLGLSPRSTYRERCDRETGKNTVE